MRRIERSGAPIQLVDGAIEISRASMQDLAQQVGTQGEIPLFHNDGVHEYFTLYKVDTPFEVTDKSHPIYQTKAFVRPELVAKLVHSQRAQIGFDVETPLPKVFPPEDITNDLLNNTGGYHIVLPEEYYGEKDYVHTLIVGEDVRKQFKLWEIDKSQIRKAGIEKLL